MYDSFVEKRLLIVLVYNTLENDKSIRDFYRKYHGQSGLENV